MLDDDTHDDQCEEELIEDEDDAPEAESTAEVGGATADELMGGPPDDGEDRDVIPCPGKGVKPDAKPAACAFNDEQVIEQLHRAALSGRWMVAVWYVDEHGTIQHLFKTQRYPFGASTPDHPCGDMSIAVNQLASWLKEEFDKHAWKAIPKAPPEMDLPIDVFPRLKRRP